MTFSAKWCTFCMDISIKSSNFVVDMRNLPIVTRYLLIANFVIFLLTSLLQGLGVDLNFLCGLHYFSAPTFHFWQPLTYMFLHANLGHILCNMLAVWMFGATIEREWGAERYIVYYIVCGLGAGLVQELVWSLMAIPPSYLPYLNTIGASGAVFGILFAFGWLYPDLPLYLFFIPVPIRARIFVTIYAAIELFAGLGSMAGFTSDNIAHFAHLGGLLFGWLLILWWKHINWREPRIFEWWRRLQSKKHRRLDDADEEDRFKDYHYQKRV